MALEAVPIGGGPPSPKTTRILFLAAVLLSACGQEPGERIRGAYDAARHPTEANKVRIEALLRDDDRDVRTTALVVMESLDLERAQAMARTAIDDRDGLVRAAAVEILGRNADPDLVQRLAALAVGDPVWQVRSRALEAIAAFPEDEAVRGAFERALGDSVRHVRRVALGAGTSSPGLVPVGALVPLATGDPDWENRVEAVRALGVSGDPAAYAGLDAAAGDPNEFVRAAAVRARGTLERSGTVRPAPSEIVEDGV